MTVFQNTSVPGSGAVAETIRYRSFRLDAPTVLDDGSIEIIASTDARVLVDQDGTYEVLSHEPGAVDISATHSLLLNHDPKWITGPVNDVRFADGQSYVRAQVDPDALTASGLSVQKAVRTRALRGISIGYVYDPADAIFDPSTKTIFVSRWRMLEVSLTPVPVDTAGMVRSYHGKHEIPIKPRPAGHHKERASTMDPETKDPQDDAGTATATATDDREELRSLVRAEIRAVLAEDTASETETEDAALTAGERSAAAIKREVDTAVREFRHQLQHEAAAARSISHVPTRVTVDESDKIQDEAVNALLMGRGVQAVARHFAMRSGNSRAGGWDRGDVVKWFFGRAAEDSNNFTQVTILASQKVMQKGYDAYTPWCEPLIDRGTASDFKTIRVGGLQVGDFSEPGEGSAFSDMTIDDGGGSGALTYRGSGLELTKEAIYNDELGLFLKKLQKMGTVAHRHEDIKVAAAIEAASFSSAALGTGALDATTLAAAWALFVAFTGPAGQKLGVVPRYLVVPPALAATAHALVTITTGSSTDAGFATNSAFPLSPLKVVVGLHFSDANDWYLAADPAEATAFTVFRHTDYPVPQVFEVDAGLVASRKFRIEYPLAVITSLHAANKPVGWGKATVA